MCLSKKYLGYVLFALLLYMATANSEILGSIGMCYKKDSPNNSRCVFGWRVRYIGNQSLGLKSLSENDIIVDTTAGVATYSTPKVTPFEGNHIVEITYSTGKFKVAPDSLERWSITPSWEGSQDWNLKYFKMSDSFMMDGDFKEPLLSCQTIPYTNREDIKFNFGNCNSYYYNALNDEIENRNPIYDKKDTCIALEAKKICDSERKSGSQSCVTEKTRLLKKQCDNGASDEKEKSLCSCTLL